MTETDVTRTRPTSRKTNLGGEKLVLDETEDALKRLTEEFGNAKFRRSKKGVPHIVVVTDTNTFSVCYFGKSKVFRVFHPYPSFGENQVKATFSDVECVVEYILGTIGRKKYEDSKV